MASLQAILSEQSAPNGVMPSLKSGRRQRTLQSVAKVVGVGMVTGVPTTLSLLPAPEHTGLLFRRSDLPGLPTIQARVSSVLDTTRRTTLGVGQTRVTLVEHVLAALAGLQVDNCIIELNAEEPPGLDGSSEGYVHALLQAGVSEQQTFKPLLELNHPISVQQNGASLTLYPRQGKGLAISYLLDYGVDSPITAQSHTEVLTPESFQKDIAHCRTFVLEREALELQRQGVGRHLKASELLVFGEQGLIDNTLRFPNEPARHKILDIVGDLSLCGFDISGHVVAYRSGHPMNIELAKALTRIVDH
ncbi:MAG: UDP-3-O-acyl-N-acetylglucosamine deacetylase [Zavarzinella sp.]